MPTCRRPTEDGFDASGFNGAAVVLDPRNGEVLAFTQPSGLRPERVRRRNRSRDVGGTQHRRSAAAAEPRAAGTLFAGIDLQDGGRPGRPRRRRHHARLQCVLRRRSRRSTAATSSAGRRADTARIDLRHAIEQSCDVFFYTVGNMLGVDRINKWATLFGLGVKSGIDLPNEVPGSCPPRSGRRSSRKRRSGTRARRSRWRSARGRCR